MKTAPRAQTHRRMIQAVIAAALAASASIILAPPVAADAVARTITFDRDTQAWFWSSNKQVYQCVPAAVADLAGNKYCLPSTVDLTNTPEPGTNPAVPISYGHLPASLKNGESDMRSYLQFDLSDIPTGSTIDSFTLELTVSRPTNTDPKHTQEHANTPGGRTPATNNEANARIKACIVTIPWSRAEGAPSANMNDQDPTKTDPVEPYVRQGVDCGLSTSAEGKPGDKWTFDLTKMAQRWVLTGENNGLALVPVMTGPVDNWTVEFHGMENHQEVQDPSDPNHERTLQQTFVSAAEAPKIRVRFTPPPPIESPPLAPPPPVTTVVPPPPAVDNSGTVAPPEPEPTQQTTILPVGSSNPKTPWYIVLLVPAGLTGFVLLSRGMGRELGSAGSNRVASMLRRRRLEAPGD